LIPWTSSFAAPKPQGNGAPDPAKQQQNAKNVRTRLAVGLAEALDLDEGGAIKIAQILRQFDERRRPFQEQVREYSQIIKRASEGDSSALSQVDQAIYRMFEVRMQIQSLNREMMIALGEGLSAQQRAKMAIFFAKFSNEQQLANAKRQQQKAAQEAASQ
jgi:hypothetical protein